MKAELIDVMGNDARVVNAARVSFSKQASSYTEEQNEKLINYLASHGHWTPFAHPTITLRETVPIFVARQRYKHTVGFVYNEVSRRYVDDEPEFYIPNVWRGRPTGSIKQGSSDEKVADQNQNWTLNGWGNLDSISYVELMSICHDVYESMISQGVAPEQARMVLPQSMYTSYYVTGSLSAWARAYKLRIDSHAQKEIQELAQQWNTIIQPLFPMSWKALTS